MKIYLNSSGMEQHVQGNILYSWHYALVEDDQENSGVLIAQVDVKLPSVEECIPAVLEKLKTEEAAIQAEAYKDLQRIKERRQALLTLTMGNANGN